MMKKRVRMMTCLVFLIASWFLVKPLYAYAAACTWNGSIGDWSDSTKWSCHAVPGQGDDVLITGGIVTLGGDASIASLSLTGGTLTGGGTLSADEITWSGGTMSGSGSTTSTTVLNFTGPAIISLLDRTFNNAGDATWNKTGHLYTNAAGTNFNNQVGATFTVQSYGATVVSGSGAFNNAGTFIKLDSGTTANSLQFNNTGTVSVESGALLFNNNSSASTSNGSYNVLSDATLRLNGLYAPINLNGNITSTGSGTIEIAGNVNVDGTFSFSGTTSITGINNGRLNLSTNATTFSTSALNMSSVSGTLTGPGHLTAGTINWSAGTMSGNGSTTALTFLNFTGPAIISLLDRTFNNAGTATWNKTGHLYINPAGAHFVNQAGATFTVQSAGPTVASGGGTYTNSGTLNLTTGNLNPTAFIQEGSGVTNLAIRGITPVSDYSQIGTTNISLAGVYNIDFISGYTPQKGDHFNLLWHGPTRTGNFSVISIPTVPDISWFLYYRDNTLHLLAANLVHIPYITK